jgi:hypothetical protein
MAIRPFNIQPLPEVAPHNTPAFTALLQRVVQLDIPGVVIRAANTLPNASDLPIQNARLLYNTDTELVNFHSPHPNPEVDNDLGLHQDPYHLSDPATEIQLNFHLTESGSALVQLLRLVNPVAQLWVPGRSNPIISDTDRALYSQGKVDTTTLRPLAHIATLYPGDILAFTDGYHAHDFRTLGSSIRRSRIRLFSVPKPQ